MRDLRVMFKDVLFASGYKQKVKTRRKTNRFKKTDSTDVSSAIVSAKLY